MGVHSPPIFTGGSELSPPMRYRRAMLSLTSLPTATDALAACVTYKVFGEPFAPRPSAVGVGRLLDGAPELGIVAGEDSGS